MTPRMEQRMEQRRPSSDYVPSCPLYLVRRVAGEPDVGTEWIGSLKAVLDVARARCGVGPVGGYVMVYRSREEADADPLATFRKASANRVRRCV